MAAERKIKPVIDNFDKQRTYRMHKGRYKRAMENEFFFEALLIDYALMEDRLRSMIYHMGFLKNRTCYQIWKQKNVCLREIVAKYKNKKEDCRLSIKNISGKMKIVRCVLKWAAYAEEDCRNDRHLSALKSQCERLDIVGLLDALDELHEWCDYRNEVIHALMNKNLESLSEELKEHAEKGMRLADILDKQERIIKKGDRIRKSANLQMN